MIAVIGSRGFFGGYFVKHLEALNVPYVEFSSKVGNFLDSGNKLISNFELPGECECVVFLSQSPFYRDINKYEDVSAINSLLPFLIAQKAIEKGVKRFIYFSSGSVYKLSPFPLNEKSEINRSAHYPLSKIHGEENLLLLKDKIEICCIRPFTMFGLGQENMLIPNLVKSIKSDAPIFLDSLINSENYDGLEISLIHVSNAVEIVHKIISSENVPNVINLSTNASLSIRQISEIVGNSLNLKPNFLYKDKPREGNLIADITKLSTFLSGFEINTKNEVETQIANVARDFGA